jgi:hypothetical protein
MKGFYAAFGRLKDSGALPVGYKYSAEPVCYTKTARIKGVMCHFSPRFLEDHHTSVCVGEKKRLDKRVTKSNIAPKNYFGGFMKKATLVLCFFVFANFVFGQSTANRHGLKESEVKGFYIIEKTTSFKPENGGIDFTAENNFVIRGRNITGREIKAKTGVYYLITDEDDPEGWLYNARFFPNFINTGEMAKSNSYGKNKSLTSQTVWKNYPGDGKYDIFFTLSPSAGMIVLGFKVAK